METRQLRYFLAVADSLHFRHAAEILHLSQPSLSQQIHQLEESLSVQLFERNKRNVRLTAAGQALAEHARAILRSIGEAEQAARQADAGLTGQLSVSFVSTAMAGILPQAMRCLRELYPGIELALHECDPKTQTDMLLEERVDIGFMHALLGESQLTSRIAQSDRLIAAVPADLAPDGAIDLVQFADVPSIMPSPYTAFGFYKHIWRAYELAGIAPRKSIFTNLIISAIQLVAAGHGIALVPDSFSRIQIPGVVYRQLTISTPPVELLAVWRKDSRSKVLTHFLEIIAAMGKPSPAPARPRKRRP
jgi:DNA-binding transcriptional LysR family regulator